MRYANIAFSHFDRHVKKGEQLDDDDELCLLRPDLFNRRPPVKTKVKPEPVTETTAVAPTNQVKESK